MMTIKCYPIAPRIEMPIGASILCVKSGEGTPTMWALVNEESIKEVREFSIYLDGQEVKEFPGEYIGSCQWVRKGAHAHVFERAAP